MVWELLYCCGICVCFISNFSVYYTIFFANSNSFLCIFKLLHSVANFRNFWICKFIHPFLKSALRAYFHIANRLFSVFSLWHPNFKSSTITLVSSNWLTDFSHQKSKLPSFAWHRCSLLNQQRSRMHFCLSSLWDFDRW